MTALQYLLGAIAGSAVGFTLGLVGGGGSILAVPLMVYLVGVDDPHVAIGTSALAVAANALIGLTGHARQHHVKWPCAATFAAAGVAGAWFGSMLGKAVDGQKLLALFSLLMIAVAGLMFRSRGREGDPGVVLDRSNAPRLLAAGTATGLLSGFFGIGGGFLIVPALVLLLRMDMRDAVGSSLVVIALNSAAGVLGHLGEGGVSWLLVALLLAGGLPGLLLGSRLAHRLPVARLRQGFAVLVILLGAALLVANLPKLVA